MASSTSTTRPNVGTSPEDTSATGRTVPATPPLAARETGGMLNALRITNLGVRFTLELAALGALAYWGSAGAGVTAHLGTRAGVPRAGQRSADAGARRVGLRWARPGSNRRRPRCKRGALPTELQALQ